jgi:hypothetical protein
MGPVGVGKYTTQPEKKFANMFKRILQPLLNWLASVRFEAKPQPAVRRQQQLARREQWEQIPLAEQIAARPLLTNAQERCISTNTRPLGLDSLGRIWIAERPSFRGFQDYVRQELNLPNRRREARWCDPYAEAKAFEL